MTLFGYALDKTGWANYNGKSLMNVRLFLLKNNLGAVLMNSSVSHEREKKTALQTGASGGTGNGRGTRNWAGESAGSNSGKFIAGQNVLCRVIKAVKEGYSVVSSNTEETGFYRCNDSLKPGEEIVAQFVCYRKSRALFCQAVNHSKDKTSRAHSIGIHEDSAMRNIAWSTMPPVDSKQEPKELE